MSDLFPFSDRTIAESKKKHEEKQLKAQQLRDKLREEKTLKLQKLLERVSTRKRKLSASRGRPGPARSERFCQHTARYNHQILQPPPVVLGPAGRRQS